MGIVIWPDWPWPLPPLDSPASTPVPSERPDEAPVSHPHPSVPQERPLVSNELLDHFCALVNRRGLLWISKLGLRGWSGRTGR